MVRRKKNCRRECGRPGGTRWEVIADLIIRITQIITWLFVRPPW